VLRMAFATRLGDRLLPVQLLALEKRTVLGLCFVRRHACCTCSAAPAVCTKAVLVHQQACSSHSVGFHGLERTACSGFLGRRAAVATCLGECVRRHTRGGARRLRAQTAVTRRSTDAGAGDGGAQHPSSTPPRSWRCMCARRVARWARRRHWRPRSARSACRRRRLVRQASAVPSGEAGCEVVAGNGGTSKRGLITVCTVFLSEALLARTLLTQSLGWCRGWLHQPSKQSGSPWRMFAVSLVLPPSRQAECAVGANL
jgi:hypothetical protein